MTVDGPALETHDLAKRYGRRTWALTGIDLAIPQGGITALVGPNAAGKSTLIKTWIGFERPTRGGVTVAGIDPWKDRWAVLGQLGYVPQSPALYDGLNGSPSVFRATNTARGRSASQLPWAGWRC